MDRRGRFPDAPFEILERDDRAGVRGLPPRPRSKRPAHVIELAERISHSAIVLAPRRRHQAPITLRVADGRSRAPHKIGRLADRERRLAPFTRSRRLRVAPQAFQHGCRTIRQCGDAQRLLLRSEEHTSELPSLMRTSYAVFCLKKKTK